MEPEGGIKGGRTPVEFERLQWEGDEESRELILTDSGCTAASFQGHEPYV